MTDRSRDRGPDYGIDGYLYMVGLLSAGMMFLAAAVVLCLVFEHALAASLLAVLAVLALAPGLLGLRYVLVGKRRHRDRLLDRIDWRGDERVLDVGTGGGILLVGAAKRASRGRCFGIDVWSAVDLSNNTKARAQKNAELEGVADRVEVLDEDARKLSFEDATFDVVVSMLCLHNIEEGQDRALAEIIRVLRPGGVAVISDLGGTETYAAAFEAAGFSVSRDAIAWDTFPFQRIVVARKPPSLAASHVAR